MTGGDGNDTYIVDNVGDVVVENANRAPTQCSRRSARARPPMSRSWSSDRQRQHRRHRQRARQHHQRQRRQQRHHRRPRRRHDSAGRRRQRHVQARPRRRRRRDRRRVARQRHARLYRHRQRPDRQSRHLLVPDVASITSIENLTGGAATIRSPAIPAPTFSPVASAKDAPSMEARTWIKQDLDTAAYATTLALADVVSVDGGWQVNGGVNGTDTLHNIEFIEHSGGRFVLVDPDGTHGGFATANEAAQHATRPGDTIVFASAPASVAITVTTDQNLIHHPLQRANHGQPHWHRQRPCYHPGDGKDFVVTGDGGWMPVHTGGGNDVVQTGGGDDAIIGGEGGGDDIYDGGSGNNTGKLSVGDALGQHRSQRLRPLPAHVTLGGTTIGDLLGHRGASGSTPIRQSACGRRGHRHRRADQHPERDRRPGQRHHHRQQRRQNVMTAAAAATPSLAAAGPIPRPTPARCWRAPSRRRRCRCHDRRQPGRLAGDRRRGRHRSSPAWRR